MPYTDEMSKPRYSSGSPCDYDKHDPDCTCTSCLTPAEKLKRKILAERAAAERATTALQMQARAMRDAEASRILSDAKKFMESKGSLIYEYSGMIEDVLFPHLVQACKAEGFACKKRWAENGYYGGVAVEIP